MCAFYPPSGPTRKPTYPTVSGTPTLSRVKPAEVCTSHSLALKRARFLPHSEVEDFGTQLLWGNFACDSVYYGKVNVLNPLKSTVCTCRPVEVGVPPG